MRVQFLTSFFPLTVMLLAMDDKPTKIFYAGTWLMLMYFVGIKRKRKRKRGASKHVVLVLELVPFLGRVLSCGEVSYKLIHEASYIFDLYER